MKYYYIFILLLITSCSLNADQEASLNKAMSAYVNAHNGGSVVAFVAMTHPNAVAYYRENGDEAFEEKFSLPSSDDGGDYLQDGTVKEVVSENGNIHVKYHFLSVEDRFYETKALEMIIMAVSDDNGISWFFIDEDDYRNEDIIQKTDRLIEK
ncbi:MAG: hypothetical protein MK066_09460 [Crocinitomicaceae bacterium]|nr:hypothetical protein [Crocinitomicaceae bacterium]